MNALAKKVTVPEFINWAMAQPRGRFELVRGEIVQMAAERARHALCKAAVHVALRDAVRKAELPCTVFPDGMTVRIDDHTAYEPDAAVQCAKVDPDALMLEAPMIVVEVLSPSTGNVDRSAKLVDYFRVESIRHYLIVDAERRVVTHHARGSGEAIATLILRDGDIVLVPPGIKVAVADLFPDED